MFDFYCLNETIFFESILYKYLKNEQKIIIKYALVFWCKINEIDYKREREKKERVNLKI